MNHTITEADRKLAEKYCILPAYDAGYFEYAAVSDFDLAAMLAKVREDERKRCADTINLSCYDLSLYAGEFTVQEWRTVSSVLQLLLLRIRSME